MIDLTGRSVFVRTQEEYLSVLKIARLQGFIWMRENHLNPIEIPFPNILNFCNGKGVTYRDEEKIKEAIAHVKYFANNKNRMSLTDKIIESMLLLANTTESQLEEVK